MGGGLGLNPRIVVSRTFENLRGAIYSTTSDPQFSYVGSKLRTETWILDTL